MLAFKSIENLIFIFENVEFIYNYLNKFKIYYIFHYLFKIEKSMQDVMQPSDFESFKRAIRI
jgi:hypothetical protein